MKATKIILFVALALLSLTSCKKESNNDSSEVTQLTQMSKDQAYGDFMLDDANDLMNTAVGDNNLMGGRFENISTVNTIPCANVTVTPAVGFPKTIRIDFGSTGCTNNGITRRGLIKIVLSDSLRLPNSTAVMTFENYFVQGFKKEGTIIWTNTSTANQRSWRREAQSVKFTAPDGRYWIHSGVKNIVQTNGANTPNVLLDDIYSITGNSTHTNSNNVTRNSLILEALQKKFICSNIDKGKIQMTGPNHTIVVDYGNGTCDNIATISIDGGTPIPITLN